MGIAQGGAICVTDESFLVVADSELLSNVAKDGGWISQGGAIYGIHGAVLTIRSSKLYKNLVDTGGLLFTASDLADAGSYGGAIFVELDSRAEVQSGPRPEGSGDTTVLAWLLSGRNYFETAF